MLLTIKKSNNQVKKNSFKDSKGKTQNGFAIVGVFFLLVVLASIIAVSFYYVRLGNKTVSQGIFNEQAYNAAKMGLEYGLYQALQNNVCNSSAQTIAFNGDFKSTYTCNQSSANENGKVLTFYEITSIGCNTTATDCSNTSAPPIENYAERSLRAISFK